MPTFFVSPSDRPEWTEDPEAFGEALREGFPGVVVRDSAEQDPTVILHFDIDDVTLGHLHRSGHVVAVDNDLEVATRVAAWWRQRVPEDVELFFYDEAFSANVPVAPGVDGEALAAHYLAAVD